MVVVVIGAGVVSGTGAGVGTVRNETTVIFTIQQRRVQLFLGLKLTYHKNSIYLRVLL